MMLGKLVSLWVLLSILWPEKWIVGERLGKSKILLIFIQCWDGVRNNHITQTILYSICDGQTHDRHLEGRVQIFIKWITFWCSPIYFLIIFFLKINKKYLLNAWHVSDTLLYPESMKINTWPCGTYSPSEKNRHMNK